MVNESRWKNDEGLICRTFCDYEREKVTASLRAAISSKFMKCREIHNGILSVIKINAFLSTFYTGAEKTNIFAVDSFGWLHFC